MGIFVNACTIMLGGLFGSLFKTKLDLKNSSIFGISVILISTIGFIENIFDVSEQALESSGLFIVVFALVIGWTLGEWLRMDDKLSNLAGTKNAYMNAFIDSTVFFGIGGLQICGPILLALEGDSSQLYLKSVIDFPFALMFGAIYGKTVMLSALPVALIQVLIALVAYLSGAYISDAMLGQLCSVGYIILFFSGFNLLCEKQHKIKNVNMIPAILVIILFNLTLSFWR